MKGYAWIFLFLYCNSIYSQSDVKEVGIPDKKFYAHAQEKTNWCWAASIQSILEFNNIFKSQNEIVERTFGKSPVLPNRGGTNDNILQSLNDWHIDLSGNDLVVEADFYKNPPTPNEIIAILGQKRPILISYRSSLSTNHAVIITSCRYIQAAGENVIQNLTVRDPWPSEANVRKDGIVHYSFSDFSKLINCFWIVTSTVKGYNPVSMTTFNECKSGFCTLLKKVLNGFDNNFVDLKGAEVTTNNYRSAIKFPGEISDYILTSEKPIYFVRFYKGKDQDSAQNVFEELKSNFSNLILEEGARHSISDEKSGVKVKMVKVLLEGDKMVVLKWLSADNDNNFHVQMLIQRKESDF